MKTLQELLIACGGDAVADGVCLPKEFRSIEIALKVMPTDVDLENNVVTFRVLLADKLEAVESGMILHTEYGPQEISLPIEAVELVHE